jgi:hypothetical protein
MGFRGVIMTYAKETVFDHSTKAAHGLGIAASESQEGYCTNIEAWRKGTIETVEQLENGDYLAVKCVLEYCPARSSANSVPG